MGDNMIVDEDNLEYSDIQTSKRLETLEKSNVKKMETVRLYDVNNN